MGRSARLAAVLVTLVVSVVGAPVVAAPWEVPASGALQGSTSAAMTNQDVVKMVGAGLAEDVIVTAIRQAARRSLDLTPTGLIELKLAKVPDSIIRAMQALEGEAAKPAPDPRPADPRPPAMSTPAASPTTSPSPRPAPAASAPPPPPPMPPASTPAPSGTTAMLQEPAILGEVFAVPTTTGAPTPLERVRMRDAKVGGPRSQGAFRPSVQDYTFYFDGAASPATFKTSDNVVLAVRIFGAADRWSKDATPAEVQKHVVLTRLQVAEGRRYLTKQDIPLDIETYGKPTPGMDSRKPERYAVSFQMKPRTPLVPGEYVVYMAGVENSAFVSNLNAGGERWAFSVLDR
jgi:hypothetical protein